MKLSITTITIRNIFKLIPFFIYAFRIRKQLEASNCVKYKITGFLFKQYTMSLWASSEDMKAFSTSGAHLDGMKKAYQKNVSKEENFIVIDADDLLDWKVAKKLLKENKRRYKKY